MLTDVIALYLALILSLFIVSLGKVNPSFLNKHTYAFSFLFPLWILVFYIMGLYRVKNLKNQGLVISIIKSLSITSIVTFAFFYFFDFFGITPKFNLLIFIFCSFGVLYIFRKLLLDFFTKKNFYKNVILFTGNDYSEMVDEIKRSPFLGVNIKEVTSDLDTTKLNDIDLAVIDNNLVSNSKLLNFLNSCKTQKLDFIDLSSFYEEVAGKVSLSALNSFWVLENLHSDIGYNYDFIKSIFDKFCAFIAILFLGPFLLLGMLLVLIFEGRPIFYSQERVGLNGKNFKIYKLKFMKNDAEKNGAQWSTPSDNRVTAVGKFLRKTRIDEIPQLFNIFNGTMSLVGPRPERPEIIEEKLKDLSPYYEFRSVVLPGITGWAQVNYRYGFSQSDALMKLRYDLFYVKNKSLLLDIRILLRTVYTVLTAAGQ